MPRATAVILTAIATEYRAVRSQLTNVTKLVHPSGTRYEVGRLNGTGWLWDVAIAEIGEGNDGSSAQTERAIAHFHPQIILFVGVGGSLKPKTVKLGDVVVATKVYGYHGGKAADGFLVRPTAFPAAHRLEQLAREISRDETWLTRLTIEPGRASPNVHLKPVAAGEVVLDSDKSALYEFLSANYNDAVAVEMEGVGLFRAAHANDSLPAMVIRGISDLAAHKENADLAGWQGVASVHAATFAAEFLSLLDPDQLLPMPRPSLPAPVGWVSISELGRNATEVISNVTMAKRPVVVTDGGVPAVLLTPIDDVQLASLIASRSDSIGADLVAAEHLLDEGQVRRFPKDLDQDTRHT